ncbi:unnamed protein product, partial [Hymenolepis diminuta]
THTHTEDPTSSNASPVAQSFSSNSLFSLETLYRALFNTTWSAQSLVFFFFHLLLVIHRYKLVTL